jgi:hypothetical protein
VVRNSTCATMPTRDANMEGWWPPMIPCAMAAACYLRARASSLRRAQEEDTIDRSIGRSSRLQLASSSDETGRNERSGGRGCWG